MPPLEVLPVSPKVLVIEDSVSVRRNVLQALRTFDVLEAADAQEAMALLRTRDDIGLVFCDFHLPDRSGLQLLQTLREDEGRRELPVVMLTTEARTSLVADAKALGAASWIIKPFMPEQLRATVRRLLPGAAERTC